MFYFLLEKLLFFIFNIIFILLCIAIFALIERKVMSSVERRKGPTLTGLFGFLQPFADGLKLLLKEIIIPSNSNFFIIFFKLLVYKKKYNINYKKSNKLKNYFLLNTYIKHYYSTNTYKNNDFTVLDSNEWTFNFTNTYFNDLLTYIDIKLFIEDENKIYDYLIRSTLNSKLNVIKKGDEGDPEVDVNLWTVSKKNNNGLYIYYYDNRAYSRYTNKSFNIYTYIFYKKKINITVDGIDYLIYCIYFLTSDSSLEGPSEVMYCNNYIYKNIDTSSFYYDANTASKIEDIFNERSEKLTEDKRDYFFRKQLLLAITDLVKNNMEQIDSKFIKYKKVPFKKKSINLFTNNKQSYHLWLNKINLKIYTNNKCNFSINIVFFMRTSFSNIISTPNKIHQLYKFNVIKDLKNYFSSELFSNELKLHRIATITGVKVISEDYYYKTGSLFLSITTNHLKTTKDLDINSKVYTSIIGNWNNVASKIYYHIYFIDSNDEIYNGKINFLMNQKITKIPLLKHMLDYSLLKEHCIIVEASTNKKVFTNENIKYSGLDLKKIDLSKLSTISEYSSDTQGNLIHNDVFLPSIYNPLEEIIESNHNSTIIYSTNIHLNSVNIQEEDLIEKNNIITKKVYFEEDSAIESDTDAY